MFIEMPDIELRKTVELTESEQGYTVFERCSCGKHKRVRFYLNVAVVEE